MVVAPPPRVRGKAAPHRSRSALRNTRVRSEAPRRIATLKVVATAAAAKRQREAVSGAVATSLPSPQRSGLFPLVGALALLGLAATSTSLMRTLVRVSKEA